MPESARRRIIAANWKMYGSRAMAAKYVQSLEPVAGVELVIFPPIGYLATLHQLLRGQAPYVSLGAQNVHEQESGAYTGESSAEMVADVGGRFSIVGHSERRRYAGESDDLVARKVLAALRGTLQPVVCVGESLEERLHDQARAVVARQLGAVAAVLTASAFENVVVAYEPVWAIGTGRSASIDQVEEMHAFIRQTVDDLAGQSTTTTVLYGGSVNEANAAGLFGSALVDGALVGGAALDGGRFVRIARALQVAKN